jgi:Uma2 family endonuclease
MSKPLKRHADYADLRAVPDNFVAEIIAGELYATPRPSVLHAHAASVLGIELGGPFHRGRNGPGGWVLLDEPELHFGEDVVVPDIAGWRRDRLETVPDAAFLTLPPDWLCEMLSPTTETIDRTRKLAIYAAQRVSHVWLVSPLRETLEVLRLESQRWSLIAKHEGQAKLRAEPFDAVELDLGALWVRQEKVER